MQIKNKIFPYPLLNKNLAFSNFNDKYFMLSYEPEETESAFILKNARVETDCDSIKELILEGKVSMCCVIECSYTIFRKAYPISFEPVDLVLSKKDFSEKVDVSMFAYASKAFTYQPKEVEEDYVGLSFEIEEYQIIAADDGFNVKISHDMTEDSMVKSMFNVIRDTTRDKDDPVYTVDYTQNRITISLADNSYSNYSLIKSVPDFKEVFFNLLLIPVLTEGLSKCFNKLDEITDLDELVNSYPWFKSIMVGYKMLEGKELTKDIINDLTPLILSQKLLRNPLGTSLDNLKKIINDKVNGGE